MSPKLGAPDPDKLIAAAKAAQFANLVKENQLVTALVLFVLWQAGAFLSAQQYAAGVMC